MKGRDFVGRRVGRLLVLKQAASRPIGRRQLSSRYWLCQCDCGNTAEVPSNNLFRETTRSCGCLQPESARRHNSGPKMERRLPEEEANLRAVISQYKGGAKDRGLEWALTNDQVLEIIKKPCVYCGIEPFRVSKAPLSNEGIVRNGIDRATNSQGYTIGNSVPCCWQCNRSKGAMDYADFIDWAKRIASNNTKLGLDTQSTAADFR